jgi:hypothetical protein
MAEKLFRRICAYMQVDRATIEFEIFPDETEELRELLPYWSGSASGWGGPVCTHMTGGRVQ